MIRQLIIGTLFTLSTSIASAQLSLQEYVDMVVAYSHTIASAEAKVDGADAEYRIAKRGVLPTVSLSSDVPDLDVGVDILQPIYNGGRNTALTRQREWGIVEAEQSLERSMLDVRYDAEVAYWSLSRAEMYHRAMCDYIAIVQTLKSVAQHRFDEGYTSKSDLLQVESRLSDAEYLLSEAEQRWIVALHRFNILRGEIATTNVLLSEGIFDNYEMPTREDVAMIVENHPDYLRAVAGRESARYSIDLRRAEYLPKVNLGLFGRWQPTLDGSANGGVMLSLNTPIFHFMERRDAIRSAESNYTSAQLQIADVVDEIVLNESNGWANLEYTHRRVEAVQRNLDIAQENLEISTYSYREGVATILDVLQAQISWLQIYENAIAAEYDYAVAIASYRYIVGK
ncbi:MAG: TolC family protein [Alistipes sp.]|nr:TolC family protein [Alistipes sp.]